MWFLVPEATFGLSLVVLGTLGAGAWLEQVLPSNFNRLDRLSCGLLGGFGLLSLLLFLVGQFAFTRMSIVLVMCPFVITGLRVLWRYIEGHDNYSCLRSRIPKLPAAIVFAVLTLTGVAGLSEVIGDWNSDTVTYHLLGPKVWLRSGVIRPVPDSSLTAFPQTAETMYGALLALGGPRAPGFSSLFTFGMLLLISSSLAMRSGLNAAQTCWVAALVSTMPAVYSGSVNCFVDGIYAAFVLAAARVGFDAEQSREWAIFGVLCGLAMGTKYTGMLALPILVLCAVAIRLSQKGESWRGATKNALMASVIACAIAAPYYVRNWVVLGCPIYPPPPGYSSFCSPKYLSPETLSQLHTYVRQRGAGLGRDFFAFMRLPYNLTYHTANFHGAGGIGLCPLALGPLGIIAARRNAFVRTLAACGFVLVLVWFLTQQESRFLIHVYVILAILSVIGWQDVLSSKKVSPQVIAGILVAISIFYGLLMMARTWSVSVHSVISPAFADVLRSKNIPYLESFQYLNSSSEAKRVLILDRSVPSFYCNKEYIKPVGQWGEQTLPGAPTPLQALEQVGTLNVSHVLDVSSEVAPFQVVDKQTTLTLVFEAKNQRVYRVK